MDRDSRQVEMFSEAEMAPAYRYVDGFMLLRPDLIRNMCVTLPFADGGVVMNEGCFGGVPVLVGGTVECRFPSSPSGKDCLGIFSDACNCGLQHHTFKV